MNEKKTYIVEIPQILGDETTIYLGTNGYAVKSLFAIVAISGGGASIVDNCYSTTAIEQNCTLDSKIPNQKLES